MPTVAREAGLGVNAVGQIVVDEFLRSVTHPEVVAVGDAAVPRGAVGAPVRMACASAVVMAAHGAECLAARLRDEPERPFRLAYAAQCVSLGRRDALIQPVRPDDSAVERVWTGRGARCSRKS